MKWIDRIRFVATNLWRRRMRTMLTVLGVVIGTACIIIMVALGLGNIAQTEKWFESMNLKEITVNNYGSDGQATQLTDTTLSSWAAMEGVEAVSPVLDVPVSITAGNYENEYASLSFVDPAVMPDLEFMEGGMFASGNYMPQIVMGASMRLGFSDPDNPVDYYSQYYQAMDEARMNGEEFDEENAPQGPDVDWTKVPVRLTFGYEAAEGETPDPNYVPPRGYDAQITGVLLGMENERSYGAYASLDAGKSIVRENPKLMQQMGVSLNSYNRAIVLAEDVDDVKDILAQIKSMGFEAYAPAESIDTMKEEQARQQSQLLMIALISLLISAIGIANTMLTSIMERYSEIGVMKVIGMKITQIKSLFLIEAAMIGLVGGIAGALIAYIFAGIANSGGGETMVLGMYFGDGAMLLVPFWLTLSAIGIAIVTGVLAGIYPASRATRVSPLEAIRRT